jgi:predicted Zn-ribbon and HTH transcriptional regulator
MKDKEFRALDKLADAISDKFDDLYIAGEFTEILEQLQDAAGKLPDTYYANFNVELTIFDTKRRRSISLLSTGFSTGGEKPDRVAKDLSTQRYIVDGEMCTVPEDYCPNCWAEWSFKLKNPTCPTCSYELGKQVRLLIDDDICPWCQEGTVSISNPSCTGCGYKVEIDKVVWG